MNLVVSRTHRAGRLASLIAGWLVLPHSVLVAAALSGGVSAIDPSVPSAIEGELSWNTFLGAGDEDYGKGIVLDAGGYVYVCGLSRESWGSPVRAHAGLSDAFVAKMDANGAVMWNTFLGGGGLESGNGIAVDRRGNVYVVGSSTATWGSPVRGFAGGEEAFVAKLDTNGSLLWNTFLGGSMPDEGLGIALDASGNAYVCGLSYASWGSPVRPYTSSKDGFAAKVDTNGSLLWSTFLGGAGGDSAPSIALDGAGNAYVAGYSRVTWGSPRRAHAGNHDGFAAKVDSGGSLIWNTFIGGADYDWANMTAVDLAGNAYVVGGSDAAWGSPINAHAGLSDAFAARLDAGGALIWNTFLGGGGFDNGSAVAVDGSGDAYVAGYSNGSWGSPVAAFAGDTDAFAAKLSAGGSLIWNTFLGGFSYDYGNAIAVDRSGSAYVTGDSEAGWGSPVRAYSALNDAFVTKLAHAGPNVTQVRSRRSTRGSAATILGSGFSTTKSENVVYFGRKRAVVKGAQSTRLRVRIPSNSKRGTVLVYVVVNGVMSNKVPFTVR